MRSPLLTGPPLTEPPLTEPPLTESRSGPPGVAVPVSGAPDPPLGAARRLQDRLRPTGPHGPITATIGLLATVLYTWSLSSAGWANSYYAAAVKSATISWKAFFFGSIDPGNFITVDKPPAALWLQALSGRLFGFSSWSMLLPEALAGVASVLVVHHLVRRWQGDWAAHLAALGFAVTPIAVAMFRNNNPDALLTFLGVAAAWALWRALESGRLRPLLVAAALTGLAFNTKMAQAFLVVPAFVVVYLVAGPPKLGRRLLQLSAALGILVVSCGWWMAVVALWPASARPYIGSTQDNSIFSLLLGYNGLDRVFGGSGAAPGGGSAGGPGGGGFGGAVGLLRLFNPLNGGQISWLLPLAAAGLLVGLWQTRRAARTDLARAGWLLWGGWALTCTAIFSLSQGVYHPYYTVQLAPAVAALAGAAGPALWRAGRRYRALMLALPAAVAGSGLWAVIVLKRTTSFAPTLRPIILVAAAAAAVALLGAAWLRRRSVTIAAATLAAAAVLAGPLAYALTTVAHPVAGSLVAAGPAVQGSGGPGQAASPGQTDTALVAYLQENRGDATYLAATFGSQGSAGLILATGEPVITIGGFNGGDPTPTLDELRQLVAEGKVRFLVVNGDGGGRAGAPPVAAGLPGGAEPPAGAPAAPPARGGGGPGSGSNQAISTWAAEAGKVVTVSGSSAVVYDLAGAA